MLIFQCQFLHSCVSLMCWPNQYCCHHGSLSNNLKKLHHFLTPSTVMMPLSHTSVKWHEFWMKKYVRPKQSKLQHSVSCITKFPMSLPLHINLYHEEHQNDVSVAPSVHVNVQVLPVAAK